MRVCAHVAKYECDHDNDVDNGLVRDNLNAGSPVLCLPGSHVKDVVDVIDRAGDAVRPATQARCRPRSNGEGGSTIDYIAALTCTRMCNRYLFSVFTFAFMASYLM